MSKIAHRLFRVSLVCVVSSVTAIASADYIISNFVSGTNRIRDDGSVAGSYFPPPEFPEFRSFGIDIGVGYAASPDLTTVYQFTNSLGSSVYIFAYDLASGAFLPDKMPQIVSSDPLLDPLLHHPFMPLIRPNDPLGRGDLFAISAIDPINFFDTARQIKLYNRENDTHVETIDPPTSQAIHDFAFGAGNRLFMAAEQGIFVYQESATGFDLVSPTPLIGSLTGKLTVGPDGHIYLINSAAGAIQRYTTNGSFIDDFIPISIAGPQSTTTSIQFGVDGNIHVLVNHEKINKYDGTTGALLSTVEFAGPGPTFFYSATGRVTYVPVPEPNAVLLAAVGIALVAIRRCRT